LYGDQGAVVSLDHATFRGNVVFGGNAVGGAIGATGGTQLTVDHSSFAGNTVTASAEDGAFGGAIGTLTPGLIATNPPAVTIAQGSFTGNLAVARVATSGDVNGQADGGEINVEDGATLTVSSSTFDANLAAAGTGGAGGAGSAGGLGGGSLGGAISNLSA